MYSYISFSKEKSIGLKSPIIYLNTEQKKRKRNNKWLKQSVELCGYKLYFKITVEKWTQG